MTCPTSACPACRADLAAIAERVAEARETIMGALATIAAGYVDADLVLDGKLHRHEDQEQPA